MQRGKVLSFHARGGFGFLVAEDATSVFFHIRQIEGLKVPKPGDTLEYESALDSQGRPAVTRARLIHTSELASKAVQS